MEQGLLKVLRTGCHKVVPYQFYRNLSYLNRKYKNEFIDKAIYKVANLRLGWYKRCAMNVVNFILSPELLETKSKGRS